MLIIGRGKELSTMTQAQHTPAPWVVGGSLIQSANQHVPVALVLTHQSEIGATDYNYHAPAIEVHTANARLIAAAPELLKAGRLKRNVIIYDGEAPRFEGDWIAVPRGDFDALRAVIIKAENA